MAEKINRVIWDFNGTLFDDVAIGIRATNKMLISRGYSPIPSADAYREIFGFPIEDYYRRVGFDFSRHPSEVLAPEWVAEYDRLEPEAGLRDGAVAALAALRAAAIGLSLISATESNMLHRQLAGLGILEYFDDVVGNDNIHAVGKSQLVLDWKGKHADERVIMIGDTEHDFACASRAGFECLLVTGGHQSRTRLEGCGCAVLDSLDACVEYIQKQNEST